MSAPLLASQPSAFLKQIDHVAIQFFHWVKWGAAGVRKAVTTRAVHPGRQSMTPA